LNLETLRTLDLGHPLGVPLRIHVSGVAVLTATNAAAGLLLCRVARPEWSLTIGLLAALAVALLLLLSAVAHEYAHLLVALRTGRPVGALILTMFGGCIMADIADESPDGLRASAAMIAAGPAASLALALGFMVLANLLRESAPVPAFVSFAVAQLNFVLLALNLLPVHPLDGGRLLALARQAWAASAAQRPAATPAQD
jgi:Zn-dependent protease